MPQAQETLTAPDRAAREAHGGGEGHQAAAEAILLSAEDLRTIGEACGGKAHWQADMARDIGYSKSNMTRYLNESRPTNPMLARLLRRVMLTRLKVITGLLSTAGLPGFDSPETMEAQALIRAGLAKLEAIRDEA